MISFNGVDYAIIVVIALSVLTGLVRGFVKELIALCVWIAAIWVGFTYSSDVSPYLQSYIHDSTLRTVIGFILLLLVTLLIGGLVSTAFGFILSRSPIRGTDRMLGMGFGFIRGAFIIALLIGIINMTSLGKDHIFKNSELYQQFKPLSDWMFSFTPKVIEEVNKKAQTDTKDDLTPHYSDEVTP